MGKNKRLKIAAALTAGTLLAALLSGCGGKAESQEAEGSADASRTAVFLHEDGFAVTAPKSFTKNETVADIGLRLERDDAVIEVFREDFSLAQECQVYSGYSNGFLKRTDLHTLDSQSEITVNGRNALRTVWHRVKSGEGDRRYYSVTDIYDGNSVYTVEVKAERPLSQLDFDVDGLCESLELFAPTQKTASASFNAENHLSRMNAETQKLYRDYFGDNGNFHWGMYYHRQPVDGMEKFEALESRVGRMDMALLYTEILEEYDPYMVYGGLVNAWNSGKICEVTLQTYINDDESAVYEILRGEHDDFLLAYAKDIKRFGHPVLMRPFNEMNGEWCNYAGYRASRDPDLYVRMYRYVYDIFRENEVDNVIWIWNPNEKSYPTFKWNHELMYYPGDEYVDVVGLSGYNTGTGIQGEIWRSMDEIYDGYYERMLGYGKPLLITEFGCADAGGDKLAWAENMFKVLPEKYPAIRGAIWLHERNTDENGNTTRSFFLDDTPGLPELFKANLDKTKR